MDSIKVKSCYDAIAGAYADELFDELSKKPLDRLLLKQFAGENKGKGRIIDLGCGPGQTTRFLADSGVTDIFGTDISTGMIAKRRNLARHLIFKSPICCL